MKISAHRIATPTFQDTIATSMESLFFLFKDKIPDPEAKVSWGFEHQRLIPSLKEYRKHDLLKDLYYTAAEMEAFRREYMATLETTNNSQEWPSHL